MNGWKAFWNSVELVWVIAAGSGLAFAVSSSLEAAYPALATQVAGARHSNIEDAIGDARRIKTTFCSTVEGANADARIRQLCGFTTSVLKENWSNNTEIMAKKRRWASLIDQFEPEHLIRERPFLGSLFDVIAEQNDILYFLKQPKTENYELFIGLVILWPFVFAFAFGLRLARAHAAFFLK